MSISYTYMQAIGIGFPGVWCTAPGNDAAYEDIVWQGGLSLPTKADLDSWIDNKVKSEMWDLIQLERDRRKSNGVKIGQWWYHSDAPSRIQQLGLVMMGSNMPANIMWKTLSGNFVLMTPALASQIFQSVAVLDMTIFAVAEQKKLAMYASSTPGAYSWETGWPLTFGE